MARAATGASGYVTSGDVRLHYLEYGAEGVPIMVVPGITSPAITWEFIAERLAGDYRVLVLVDPPLTGPGRPEYPTSLEAFMDQLEKARAGATAEDMRPYFPTWDDEQLEIRAEWLPTCDETAVRETWLNFHREDVFDYLRRLKPPVLFMYGG